MITPGTNISSLELAAPLVTECHPNCNGGCTVAYSAANCTSCSADSELKDGGAVCLRKAIINPAEGKVEDFSKITWSEDNVQNPVVKSKLD